MRSTYSVTQKSRMHQQKCIRLFSYVRKTEQCKIPETNHKHD